MECIDFLFDSFMSVKKNNETKTTSQYEKMVNHARAMRLFL